MTIQIEPKAAHLALVCESYEGPATAYGVADWALDYQARTGVALRVNTAVVLDATGCHLYDTEYSRRPGAWFGGAGF